MALGLISQMDLQQKYKIETAMNTNKDPCMYSLSPCKKNTPAKLSPYTILS